MDGKKKSPRRGDEGLQKNNQDSTNYSRIPTFPANERYSTHCRAVLACLLTGAKVNQFIYHQTTGLPLVDFRTRISNLRLDYYWPIEDEFHNTRDFNGEPRRVKQYWLDRERLQSLYKRSPEFKHRCQLFRENFFKQEGGA